MLSCNLAFSSGEHSWSDLELFLLESLVAKNYFLHKSAREAYQSYLQSYAQHPLKHIFNVHSLDLLRVSKSFGFSVPPKVHLKISLKSKTRERGRTGPHGLSEDNPYGQPNKKNRQWSR